MIKTNIENVELEIFTQIYSEIHNLSYWIFFT